MEKKVRESYKTDSCSEAPDVQLNLNVRGLSPSATVAINDYSNELIQAGKRVFKMGLGQSPFPVPAPIVEALKKNAFQKDYLPVKGLQELREAVAEHHYRTFKIDCTPDDVLVGPGSKELMFVLQLVYYGDLIIPTPTWVSYAPQAQIIGRQVRLLPTRPEDNWRISVSQLDKLCRSDPDRPRILILNYPSNPTGTSYSHDELMELAELGKKYKIILLSDEIYAKLHFKGSHSSIVPMYPEGTIFSGGLSKWCGAGGWRLGLFVFPACLHWLLDAMAAVATETFTSTSAPIQYAAVEAFKASEELDLYILQSRRILQSLGMKLVSTLRDAGINIITPEGGFYLFPDFVPMAEKLRKRGITTSVELCKRLMKEVGVAILPGSEFGRPPEELTARIAYVNFNGAEAMERVKEIHIDREPEDSFLKEYLSEPIEAVQRLCEWVNM